MEDCVLLPTCTRACYADWRVPRIFSGASFGFGRVNVCYTRKVGAGLKDYLKKMEDQIEQYKREKWIHI